MAAYASSALLAAVAVTGVSMSETLAQRSASEHAATEFAVTVAPEFSLEGSVDGVGWESSEVVVDLVFDADEMALEVGREHTVHAPMQVRSAAGTNISAVATVVEDGLGNSDFAEALRGEIYLEPDSCDGDGVADASVITTDPVLGGQRSETFEIPAPAVPGEVGEAVDLCVAVWLDNNNWLLGGEVSDIERATWVVDAAAL